METRRATDDINRMKLTRLALFPVLLASLSSAPDKDELAFQPEKGVSVARSVETKDHSQLVSSEVAFDGETIPADEMDEVSIDIEDVEKINVTDRFVASEGGRPLELERSFDALSAETRTRSGSGEDAEDQTETSASKLEGARVVFRWNTDESRYDAKYSTEEGASRDSELLDGLREDMDLRAMLPDKKVSADDEWKVDGSAFAGVLWAGGELRLEADSESEDAESRRELELEALEHLGGSITATYNGRREVGGRSMGVIHVEAELETKSDAESSDEDGSLEQTLTAGWTLTGEILWDLDGGHLGGFELSGQKKTTFAQTFHSSEGDHKFEQTLHFEGEHGIRCTVERR
jgi:hypothetical protein